MLSLRLSPPSPAEIVEANAFILSVTFLRFATQTTWAGQRCQPSPVGVEQYGRQGFRIQWEEKDLE